SVLINQTTNVDPIGPRPLVVVPATNVAATSAGFPLGFQPSSDPYGFGAQLWVGHRNKREPAILPNQAPTASVAASVTTITLPCPPGMVSDTCPTSATGSVQLTTTA